MKVVLASKNKHKLIEISKITEQFNMELVLQSELGVDIDVEETGTTFEENSFLKAEAVMKATGLPALADDSGIAVDALNGEPGIGLEADGQLHEPEHRACKAQRQSGYGNQLAQLLPFGKLLLQIGKLLLTLGAGPLALPLEVALAGHIGNVVLAGDLLADFPQNLTFFLSVHALSLLVYSDGADR